MHQLETSKHAAAREIPTPMLSSSEQPGMGIVMGVHVRLSGHAWVASAALAA